MALKGNVQYETQGEIAVLTVDNPPVNALSGGVRQGLWEGISKAQEDSSVKAIVLVGNGRAFIAGADINEFGGGMNKGASLLDVFDKMEASEKPIIAAINGHALGGGLETALVCDYRIALPKVTMGLPEANLGLLPGAGGTQRLPRLIGVEAGLNAILSAAPFTAAKAKELGIIDAIIEGDILEGALAYAKNIIDQGAPTRKVRHIEEHIEAAKGNDEIFAKARKMVSKTRRGQLAPEMIIQSVEAALTADSFDAGLKVEQLRFKDCMRGQSKPMIHIFFNERAAAKIPDIPRDTPIQKINSAGVIGAGTMGGGITMNFLNAGIPVTLVDKDQKGLERGIAVIEKNYANTVKKGRLSEETKDKRMALLTATTEFSQLNEADIIIEAVYENLKLKQEIFAELDKIAKPEAILASNTSALNIDKIAEATSRPEKVIGTHFFSPANVMKLLEVVRGTNTSKETIASCMKLGKAIGKVAVLAGNCPGFIGNRMVFKYIQQAQQLVLDGALPWDVDKAIFEFGLPMGPFQMMDLSGLDLGWRARKMGGKGGLASNNPFDAITDELCEQGRYGQKTQKGIYTYDEKRTPIPDDSVAKIITEKRAELGITPREISQEEIVKRCILALANEGAKILQEGIAIRASDIDVTYVYGYGFPVYEGGPMYYADALGLDTVCADLESYGLEPAPLLKELAAEGGKLGKWQAPKQAATQPA